MNLTQVLRPECIKVPLLSNNKEAAITELVDLLDASKQLLDRNVALDAILAREKVRSTGIGSGIAIPHGKCKAVKQLTMALGITKDAIDFTSIDGKPVRIIILLVSPVDQTGPHIQALARISRIMLDETFRDKLESAKSSEEVTKIIEEKENE